MVIKTVEFVQKKEEKIRKSTWVWEKWWFWSILTIRINWIIKGTNHTKAIKCRWLNLRLKNYIYSYSFNS